MDDEVEIPPEYPLEQWIRDYEWFAKKTKEVADSEEGILSRHFEAHFYPTRNHDPRAAQYCMRRFWEAMAYLDRNTHAIDFGKAGVVGEKKALVSRAVVIALWRFYAARPDHDIGLDIPIEVFQSVIKEELG